MATIGTLNIVLSTSTAKFTSGISSASHSLRGFTSSVSSVKPVLAGLGVALGGAGLAMALKKIVSAGAAFEHQMQAVKAVSGASGKEFAALSAEAQRLGAKTQFTAAQAAEGMEVLAQAGFDTGAILQTIEPTLNLAAAGSVALSEAADVAASTMRSMGIATDQLQTVVDVLAKASSASNADVSGLGEALKTAGPTAHVAGKSLEETVAAIEALSNAGIKGEEAGTALRQIMIKLADRTPEAQKALKSLGVSTLDAQGNIRSFADIADDLNHKLAGMGTGKKLEKLSAIFDARAASAFAAMMGQGGDALRKFESELQNAGGEAAKQAETRMDSLTGSWTKFTSAVEGLSITMMQGTGGWLRALVDWGTTAVTWMNTVWASIGATIGAATSAIWEMVSVGWAAILDLTNTLFGGVFDSTNTGMQDMTELVVVGLAMAEFAFTHWRDIAAIAGLKVIAGVVTLGNQLSHVFTEVIPKTLDWLANNWRDIFFTLFDFTATVFINLGKNIRGAMGEIWDYIKSAGANKLEFTWTPLTEGFVNAVRELPEIADREIGQLEAAMYQDIRTREEALGSDLAGFTAQRLDEFHQRERAAGEKPDFGPGLPPPPTAMPGEAALDAGGGKDARPKALELGTAEAFHAAFGAEKSDSRTFSDMLKQLIKSQRDTERIRLLQEKNNVAAAQF